MNSPLAADPRLGALVELARAAADSILAIYARPFVVHQKADHSPVTEADLAAQAIINAGLARISPGLPVVSEEAEPAAWAQRQTWSRYWLVDPLDGTREFVKRNGEFTVNIALIEAQRPVLGIVLAPVSGAVWVGCAGAGAWMQTVPGAAWQRLQSRPLAQPAIVAGSRSYAQAQPTALIPLVGADYQALPLGSSLKFCLLAEGRADLYLRLGATCEWDTAAAQCVLEQAGGAVYDLQGHSLRYQRGPSLINPEFIAVGDPSVHWDQRLQQLQASRDTSVT